MKISIIGAGFFGIAIAIKLKKRNKNYQVEIFEKNNDILSGSSGKNQFRWHRGYHYPRSQKTIEECLSSYESFKTNLKNCTLESSNYYAISSKESLTSSDEFIDVCKKNKLYYKKIKLDILKSNKISDVFKVKEKIIDIRLVKKQLKEKIEHHKIKINFNKEVKNIENLKKNSDLVILSTYTDNDFLAKEKISKDTKFQLVEKIVVKVPKIYKKKSIVVLDGNFMCIDPFYLKDHSLLGTVKDSVIKETVGKKLPLSKLELSYLNKESIRNPKNSKFFQIKKTFNEYFNYFEKIKYVKSFYVIRCTRVSNEDARKSEIKMRGNVVKIFSGKWVSCFKVAENLIKIL